MTTFLLAERVIISLMLSSVLPLELAQDLFQNMGDIKRLRMCALMLTVILRFDN